MDQKQSMLTYLSLAEQPISAPGLLISEQERKAGIVYLHGSVFQNFIRFVTARIHEGPLQEITIESNQKTKIVFLYASNAREFIKLNEQKLATTGVCRFGAGYTVELADSTVWSDNHFMMIHPFKERRRLTFARQKLFSQNLTAAKWRRDIAEVVGTHSIDFLWVFNSGNGELSYLHDSLRLPLIYQTSSILIWIPQPLLSLPARLSLERSWKDLRN